MSWTDSELNLIAKEKNKNETYAMLIKKHSDLDILEKAKELQGNGFITFAEQQTRAFEKCYDNFKHEYGSAIKEIEDEKKRKELQKQQEENNRIKKEAQRKQLKNMKAKILVVSSKKKKVWLKPFANTDFYARAAQFEERKGKDLDKLKQKGVPENIIYDILNTQEYDAFAMALKLAKKKKIGPYRLPENRREFRQKDMGTLIRAGFDYDIVTEVLSAEISDDEL